MWENVPKAMRDTLLYEYESNLPMQPHALALGMPIQTLKRRLREHRESLTYPPDGSLPVKTIVPMSSGKPRSTLSDLRYADPDTDQAAWVAALADLRTTMRYVTVMHLCDIHFPYQFDPALSVVYQLIRYVKPHIIVVGSDAGDFPMLSSFISDPDEATTDGDALDEFQEHWDRHIDMVTKEHPDAVLVFIIGNHEKRVWDFIMRLSPAIRHTVWRRFVEIVRSGGRVLWIGDVDTVRIGPLLVTHGNRAGANPAKALFEDAAGQVSVMAGHVHRLSYFGKRGEDFMVEAITSGCLTNYPHYLKRKRAAKWQLGTALAEVDLEGREVKFDNLKFELEPDLCYVRFERQLFTAIVPRPVGFLPIAL